MDKGDRKVERVVAASVLSDQLDDGGDGVPAEGEVRAGGGSGEGRAVEGYQDGVVHHTVVLLAYNEGDGMRHVR